MKFGISSIHVCARDIIISGFTAAIICLRFQLMSVNVSIDSDGWSDTTFVDILISVGHSASRNPIYVRRCVFLVIWSTVSDTDNSL
jgi:hypothetical protein